MLAKAKRNLSHGQYSALSPRGAHEHFSVDFYSITKTEKGNKEILTIVDTFTSYVQFVPCPDRTAQTFVKNFNKHVVFKTGVPLHLRSDAAQEFLSHVSEEYMDMMKINHTSTLGYNPTGNARCERVHDCLGSMLRMLTDEQYHNLEDELNSIAHGWNTTFHQTLGCTPFELHHGVPARSAPEALIAQGSHDTVPTVSSALERVRKHAALVKQQAAAHAEHVRTERMSALNKKKQPAKHKIGDRVMVHKPPNHNDTVVRNRKAKHLMRFVGPARIEQILNESGTAFGVRMIDSDECHERTIANIRPCPKMEFTRTVHPANKVGGTVVDDMQIVYHHGKIPLGQTIALLDSEGTNTFRLGKVIENHKEWHQVHLFIARGKNKTRKRIALHQLVFKLGFIDPKDGKLVQGARNAKHYGALPWTAKIDKASNLVIATDVQLDGRGRLTKASLQQLPDTHTAETS